jgi:hypothetical protein
LTTESIFSEPAPQIKALVRNLSAFTTLFAPGKSWDNVRSTAAPYTESRLTRSVANERIGFLVVEHHVVGDLAVTPFVLLKLALNELKRLLDMLKDREVWILDVLPRFLLIPCCDEEGHCSNTRQPGPAGVETRSWQEDPRGAGGAQCSACGPPFCAAGQVHRNRRFADWHQGRLHGDSHGHPVQTWGRDPVHGERRAYTKIGLALLHFLDKKKRVTPTALSRKRTRDSGSPTCDDDRPDTRGRDRERGGYRRESAPSAPPAPMRSAYATYPGDFDRRRESPDW